ncbi:hypothetical protein CDA63_06945 [Hymenobacter amundsenii]|uniref:Uncharacterized protein n=1 Tax=Hymenobacter amundsenii TaxID=2006685 RepID=A0A246FMJ3_9BACT|nr:hypothetical protein CDA63_06945 [Hymenobacter amundsenii]
MAQHYLNLSRQLITLPSRTVYVAQLLDGRPDKLPIGLVYQGLNGHSTTVLFRRGLESELTEFLQQQVPARPADHAVVLCLRQLRVSERMAGLGEKASADLAADVYEQRPDGYHFVRSVAAHTSARTPEATDLHAYHVALLLQKCLEQLTTYDWSEAATGPTLTLGQLLADTPPATVPAASASGPAMLREFPRAGVYYTFEQFLTNTPAPGLRVSADTVAFGFGAPQARLQWLGVPRLRVKVVNEKNQNQPTKEVWGFSDGHQLFVQHQKNFFPLHRHRDFFTFVGETPPDVAYMQARAQAQARAQLSAAALGVGFSRVHGIDHSAEPMGYALDMRTGERPVSEPTAAPASPYRHGLYLPVPLCRRLNRASCFFARQPSGRPATSPRIPGDSLSFARPDTSAVPGVAWLALSTHHT